MSRLKDLIHEVHRRSLWQVLAIYIGTSWVVLQVVDTLTSNYGLPRWFPALALALLLMGLPIVLATAFVQEGVAIAQAPEPTPTIEETAESASAASAESVPARSGKLGRLFTWRNALLGALSAAALWGVVTTGWLLSGGSAPLVVKAEAADFFGPRDRVVVAEFGNETNQSALGLAVREAVITDLDQSSYVNVVDEVGLRAELARMRLPDTVRVDVELAREVARRGGYPAVVAGDVAPLGAGYQLTARIIEAATGNVAVRVRETADDDAGIVAATERLARLVRRHLGESLASIRRSAPLPQVTTASLEALELYARSREYNDRGSVDSAIALLHQAVALDTAFASAYRGLAVYNANLGNLSAAQAASDRAYLYADRLPPKERFLTMAFYHSVRNRMDSAAYYYRFAIETDSNDYVPVNNLGDIYERMGRYEDALQLYRRAYELAPDNQSMQVNLQSAAQELGLDPLADSAAAALRTRFPGNGTTDYMQASRHYYRKEFAEAESISAAVAGSPEPVSQAWGRGFLFSVLALRGRIEEALAQADSVAEPAMGSGTLLPLYASAMGAAYAALAAGRPERARPILETALDAARRQTMPARRYLALGFVATGYALTGDAGVTRSLLTELDSVAAIGDFRPNGSAELVRAIIALQDDQPEEAIEHLGRARAADYGVPLAGERLLLGDAYAAVGRLANAAAQYDTLAQGVRLDFRDLFSDGPIRPLAHERLGALYLALGDTAAAASHLARFVDLWSNADPDLQPRVEAARRTLASLAGEQR